MLLLVVVLLLLLLVLLLLTPLRSGRHSIGGSLASSYFNDGRDDISPLSDGGSSSSSDSRRAARYNSMISVEVTATCHSHSTAAPQTDLRTSSQLLNVNAPGAGTRKAPVADSVSNPLLLITQYQVRAAADASNDASSVASGGCICGGKAKKQACTCGTVIAGGGNAAMAAAWSRNAPADTGNSMSRCRVCKQRVRNAPDPRHMGSPPAACVRVPQVISAVHPLVNSL